MRRGPRLPRPSPSWALYAPLALAVLIAVVFGRGPRRHYPIAPILEAIRMVESGGRDDAPDGDGGAAIGPFQIHRSYWDDALRAAPALGGDYQDCRRRDYAVRVVEAYMQYWVPAAWREGDAEVIARTHNGGPLGSSKEATLKYWHKVRAQLERAVEE